ncbi:O-antigen ligase family protein [Cellulomonas xiejunii]|uniref:O-antigen ligase family protein n=1 Tax=Cellulomonas xiejunii TaxID=2968083 RepID=UPI001D0E5B58|nr:O-antigen ligase family protein [Cellulomonas xiejunii]MCC2314578.1 hypothetical protein [Cellulomonas xiejunii]
MTTVADAAVPVSHARRVRLRVEDLPAWPFALPFVAYPAAWLLGIGDVVWVIAGAVVVLVLLRTDGVRVPRGFGVWLMFLAWSTASFFQLDSGGRLLGFGYRQALYLSATALAVYAYNARRSVTDAVVGRVLTYFLGVMTAGGLLALAQPLLTFRTPLSYVVPASLQSNELIGEMVVRRTTQWNPDAWVVLEPRPSAPFLYTNTWGNVYSIVLPFVLLHLVRRWHSRSRPWLLALVATSVVVAVLTLNRGMFVGLGVVVAWLGLQALRAGRLRQLAAGLVLLAAAVPAWLASSASASLFDRVETSSSTTDRAALYVETWDRTLESPLFGYGAPRPASVPWLPSVGTQGQLWTVLFSHGVVGLGLFLAWFVVVVVRSWRRADVLGAVATGVVLATIVESVFYGMMTGLNVSLLASVLALRPPSEPEGGPDPAASVAGDAVRGGPSGARQPVMAGGAS